MFGIWDDPVEGLQIEAWEGRLTEIERQIAGLRAEQANIIRCLDRVQVDTADGARTMGDWAAAHLDVSHQTASRLMTVADAADLKSMPTWAREPGGWTGRLCWSDSVKPALRLSCSLRRRRGIRWVGSMGPVDRLRHLTPADEQDLFKYCYLVVQPSLDESAFKLWGHLPSSTGR